MQSTSHFVPEFPVGDLHRLFTASMSILGRLWLAPVQTDKFGTQRMVLSAPDEKHPLIHFRRMKASIVGEEIPPLSLAESVMPCLAAAFKAIHMEPLLGLWQQEGDKLLQLADPEYLAPTTINQYRVDKRRSDVFGLASVPSGNSILMLNLYGNNLKPRVMHLLRKQEFVEDAAYDEISKALERRQSGMLENLYGPDFR